MRAAVLGAGTMGAGIAQVLAAAGAEVALRDVSEEFVARGAASLDRSLAKAVEKGKLTAEARAALRARVRTTLDLADAVRDAQLVIEAAPEDMMLKQRIFAEVSALAPGDALLASNTSSLSIGRIASAARRPERVLGLHFFNPPPVMKLLEIVHHPGTASDVVMRAQALALAWGKEAILVRDSPGFATSRLGVALGLEAIRMLESEVASAEDIDKAMALGYNHPMGPLRLTDLVGLDVRLAIAEHLARELGPRFEPPALLRSMVKAGKLGQKSGEGFYRW
ncbi:MAG: 3-hydroxyacyl-CoA dehydrogenase family protein [Thermoplasmatota archaeon]